MPASGFESSTILPRPTHTCPSRRSAPPASCLGHRPRSHAKATTSPIGLTGGRVKSNRMSASPSTAAGPPVAPASAGEGHEGPPRHALLLTVCCVARVHGHPRYIDRQRRAADDPGQPRLLDNRSAVGDQRLHDHLRRLPDAQRTRRGPVRAPAHVRHRAHRIRAGLAGGRHGRDARAACRRARPAGPWRRDHAPPPRWRSSPRPLHPVPNATARSACGAR